MLGFSTYPHHRLLTSCKSNDFAAFDMQNMFIDMKSMRKKKKLSRHMKKRAKKKSHHVYSDVKSNHRRLIGLKFDVICISKHSIHPYLMIQVGFSSGFKMISSLEIKCCSVNHILWFKTFLFVFSTVNQLKWMLNENICGLRI